MHNLLLILDQRMNSFREEKVKENVLKFTTRLYTDSFMGKRLTRIRPRLRDACFCTTFTVSVIVFLPTKNPIKCEARAPKPATDSCVSTKHNFRSGENYPQMGYVFNNIYYYIITYIIT